MIINTAGRILIQHLLHDTSSSQFNVWFNLWRFKSKINAYHGEGLFF